MPKERSAIRISSETHDHHIGTFEKCDFVGEPLETTVQPSITFERCTFRDCTFQGISFSQKSSFNQCTFLNCEIANCQFSNCLIGNTLFEHVRFASSLIAGRIETLHFTDCSFANSSEVNDQGTGGLARFQTTRIQRNSRLIGTITDTDHCDVDTLAYLLRAKRAARWGIWYTHHPFQSPFVRALWWLTDYGYSSHRLILSLAVCTIVFSLLYLLPLFFGADTTFLNQNAASTPRVLIIIQSVYFSLVTTATVGFGDLHPDTSLSGPVILASLQIITGGYLWAALIARLVSITQE